MDLMWPKVRIRKEKTLVGTGNRIEESWLPLWLQGHSYAEQLDYPEDNLSQPFPNLGTC